MHQFLPSLPLQGARIVVVGAGPEAENKLRLFRTAPADLVWYALDRAAPAPNDLNPRTTIIAGRKPGFRAFAGARLVFLAVGDRGFARRLRARARRAGAWVNVVDDPALCDFHTPAIIDRGRLTIALATGGAAPILARDLRARLEQVVPPGAGLLVEAANALREAVGEAFATVDARRRFWEGALRGPAARAADAGDAAETRRRLIEALDRARDGEAEPGVVHLVGAGPGDPELLTVRAARLIRDADVIVHDRLVSPQVLDRARRDALRIDVGKRRGDHPVPQARICEILIEHARAGARVVRLKGGDSFVFGRGGEELDAVRAAGIAVEVTPGVSAALACAASAGLPLTHRDCAQAVTFVTGQPKTDGPPLDYAALAAPGHTLVVYMGVARAAEIAARLIAAGRAPSTPVAVVENGSMPDERVIAGRLAGLGDLVRRAAVRGPAVIVIGDVAGRALERPDAVRALAGRAMEAA